VNLSTIRNLACQRSRDKAKVVFVEKQRKIALVTYQVISLSLKINTFSVIIVITYKRYNPTYSNKMSNSRMSKPEPKLFNSPIFQNISLNVNKCIEI
jgi:hypothetical protein